ncbi:glycosyltransferase family 2 protein [Paragemmobacter straminiformis]|uniref:Glycosyltransferase family 2 protein n=1 Tax=Paragemmobacter straminiformis TaxID=2045119 RepID=A0A842ICN1_9RHOB|nr:glycosyltransferase family 2 protein [Gemmobacter straminiformis]MBC2836854.1 glycosyltransferase family 2 protein [Gemmobacter straminiformis]
MRVSCLIPAHNEAPRIGAVLDAALANPLIDEVIVIDDGSTDATAHVAARPGVRLLHMAQNGGKTRALAAGIALSQGRYLLFLDADLVGLTPRDLTRLLLPVLTGKAATSISLRRNAPFLWRWIGLDYISGERVLPRAMIAPHAEALCRLPRFGVEVYINALWIAARHPIAVVRWRGVASPTKARKRGLVAGIRADIAMLHDIARAIGPAAALRQILSLLRQSRSA